MYRFYRAAQPPSIAMGDPVILEATSEHRNVTRPATSLMGIKRPIGVPSLRKSFWKRKKKQRVKLDNQMQMCAYYPYVVRSVDCIPNLDVLFNSQWIYQLIRSPGVVGGGFHLKHCNVAGQFSCQSMTRMSRVRTSYWLNYFLKEIKYAYLVYYII